MRTILQILGVVTLYTCLLPARAQEQMQQQIAEPLDMTGVVRAGAPYCEKVKLLANAAELVMGILFCLVLVASLRRAKDKALAWRNGCSLLTVVSMTCFVLWLYQTDVRIKCLDPLLAVPGGRAIFYFFDDFALISTGVSVLLLLGGVLVSVAGWRKSSKENTALAGTLICVGAMAFALGLFFCSCIYECTIPQGSYFQ